ncbi:hypothetical protein [Leptospirillum sp. Group II 'CF-1']|jgi:hypothetical protein|uniref:hypothetical protein n=1 Tax=Leptospirillum sp. Group II 'CF-1' TaxID=1660083 RepID=UPI0012E250F0|nr:hypothetical protein [Leptospirillum sp. Group II 'CF-1']
MFLKKREDKGSFKFSEQGIGGIVVAFQRSVAKNHSSEMRKICGGNIGVSGYLGYVDRRFCKHGNDRNCADKREKADEDDQESNKHPGRNFEVLPILPLFPDNKEGKCRKKKECNESSAFHKRIRYGVEYP